jgi:steroid 5-alpha reductase family enzyme
MRKRWGPAFPIISFATVYLLQGTLMWVVSLPLQLSHRAEGSIGVLAIVGVILWAVGVYFEAVGDLQLSRFKGDPSNEGKVLDTGLWRLTRHPNYFGDACVWWGIALVACSVSVGRWGLIGAAVMNILLLKVSGVALLERSLVRRKPEYQAYIDRTSAFIPRPPKSS